MYSLLDYKNHFEKLDRVKSGRLSLVDNVKYFLAKIEHEKNLNSFNFVFQDAVEDAERIEKKIRSGNFGKLAGMVVAVKDVISIKDKPLTCSSKILSNFISTYNSTVVERLLKEDAIIIGKTNCDEFAMGSSNENSAFGKVLNPIDKKRVPGGSSGGSAAAVAARLCDVALGSDTGGSVRQPAAFCGVYGLKPTYGRVSRFGLTAFASSFDSIGHFANNVEDLALVLSVIAGQDEYDSTCSREEVPDYLSELEKRKKYKIGIPEEYFSDGLNDEIRTAIDKQIKLLEQNGFTIMDISLPHTEYSIATYYIISTAEASSNLARFDGARYGIRAKDCRNLTDMYIQSRAEGLGDEVKRRIMLGTYVLSAGYYDAYYKKAQKVRRLIKNDFEAVFEKVDIILTPTTPTIAFKFGEKLDDPLQMYLGDIYTTSVNLAGIPGINVPIGKARNRLPIGMQLIASHFNETKLLQMCGALQSIAEV